MRPVTIRDLGRPDLARVRQIDAQVYPEPWSRRLWLAELSRPHRIYLAAERDGALCGYAGALTAAGDAHILTIVADPARQRRGVATSLMLEVIRRAVEAGSSDLTLEVRVTNHPAQALYRRFGMAPAGIRPGYYEPDNEDALVMWAHDIDGSEYGARLQRIEQDLQGVVAS